ncbi:MAG: NAD(+)/NADH kinase [Elusimicrobia bacterium]|nr:NAD(+)/NADH kinase [Elusimicrobiota bacterium]
MASLRRPTPPFPVALFHNPNNPSAQRALKTLRSWLSARSIRVLGPRHIKSARAAVALGGDGTLLAAARTAAPLGVPVLGINLGRLGFLTATDVHRARPLLEKLVSGRLVSSDRMMLEALPPQGPTLPIVNDCVIQGATAGRVVRLSVRVDGESLGTYVGDGLIVATPTGSTAYSMAAGGPIVSPEIDLILLTPICPHSLSQRPVLIPPGSVVEVRLEPRHPREKLVVLVDGREPFTLSPGEKVVLRRMKARLQTLSEKDRSFFGVLREKLLWGER